MVRSPRTVRVSTRKSSTGCPTFIPAIPLRLMEEGPIAALPTQPTHCLFSRCCRRPVPCLAEPCLGRAPPVTFGIASRRSRRVRWGNRVRAKIRHSVFSHSVRGGRNARRKFRIAPHPAKMKSPPRIRTERAASPMPHGPAPVLTHANNPKMQQAKHTKLSAMPKQKWKVRLICSNDPQQRPRAIGAKCKQSGLAGSAACGG